MTDAPFSSPAPSVILSGITHRYGRLTAVDDVSLSVAPREVVCIVGPSGCGKSTLLRLISGLETVQAGTITVDGAPLATADRSLPPEKRPVGMMFQDFALFPHLTVAGNIAFGQTDRPRAERKRRVAELLETMALTRYADVYPHTLSGGQQQRVALARAMARDPKVLLLDEPFSALDEQLRRSVREEVVRIIRATGVATIVVTHDPEEAMEMGNRVVVMEAGRVIQADSPVNLYKRPANSFVARLFGEVNRFQSTVSDGRIVTPLGLIQAPHLPGGTRVEVACRVEDLELVPLGARPDAVPVRVRHSSFLGSATRVCLDLPGGAPEIHARLPGHVDVHAGQELSAAMAAERVMVFPAE
ncbi:sulfate ABC transporter ATP-binding protein [Azospirillum thiophilum]|uniref:Sulfate ABC transporter ATP-binding protein n=1 Tax=Azospirillum thiophilum TaxID=528244 RepID=A0AAC8VYV4_9PROT|nr:ABC transporter ATP-binding protein [Azospirillum thiophilum]ALG71765.1 sulfate ABC transporter ATP-binding protein [Azospirillum thiophilum]KJR66827.1 sulfate ABC transporter ATP-binding protein [Azospirillum thiophilum]